MISDGNTFTVFSGLRYVRVPLPASRAMFSGGIPPSSIPSEGKKKSIISILGPGSFYHAKYYGMDCDVQPNTEQGEDAGGRQCGPRGVPYCEKVNKQAVDEFLLPGSVYFSSVDFPEALQGFPVGEEKKSRIGARFYKGFIRIPIGRGTGDHYWGNTCLILPRKVQSGKSPDRKGHPV